MEQSVCRIAERDSIHCVPVRGPEQGAGSDRARSSAENKRAREKRDFPRTGLQSRNQCHCRELHLAWSDWQQLPKMEPRAEERYKLVDGVLVSQTDMAGDSNHTCLRSALRELTSRVWIQRRHVRTHTKPIVNV